MVFCNVMLWSVANMSQNLRSNCCLHLQDRSLTNLWDSKACYRDSLYRTNLCYIPMWLQKKLSSLLFIATLPALGRSIQTSLKKIHCHLMSHLFNLWLWNVLYGSRTLIFYFLQNAPWIPWILLCQVLQSVTLLFYLFFIVFVCFTPHLWILMIIFCELWTLVLFHSISMK